MFSDTTQYEAELLCLKQRLKDKIKTSFDDIYVDCLYNNFNVWTGGLLGTSKKEFITFTNGRNEHWCDKISIVFETGFNSVLKVVYTVYKDINIETLQFYIDDFFEKQHLFEEKWFVCSKCKQEIEFLDDETKWCFDCHPFTSSSYATVSEPLLSHP